MLNTEKPSSNPATKTYGQRTSVLWSTARQSPVMAPIGGFRLSHVEHVETAAARAVELVLMGSRIVPDVHVVVAPKVSARHDRLRWWHVPGYGGLDNLGPRGNRNPADEPVSGVAAQELPHVIDLHLAD